MVNDAAVPHAFCPSAGSVAGVTLPDTEVAQLAFLTAQRVSPPYLTNHCVRTYHFGSLLANTKRLRIDSEMFFSRVCSTTWGSRSTMPVPCLSKLRAPFLRRPF